MTRRLALALVPPAALALLAALLGGVVATVGSSPPLAQARADHPVPAPLKEPPPSSFECRWADSPITIDGVADEPAWAHAQPITAFHLPWLGDKARMARTATTAKLLWDREYLYFHARMEDSDLFADIKEHDGALWKNDVFEIFLRPDAEKTGYYEFQVSAAGTRFDAFYPKYDNDKIGEWAKAGAFHMQAKVKLDGTLNKRGDADRGWGVEGRIPWKDFARTGGRPVPGEAWKLNLCRFDYHADWKGPELSCVAPIAKKKLPAFFHQSDDFATLTFVGADAKTSRPFGIETREPLTTSTVVGFPDPPPPFVATRVLDKYRPEFPIFTVRIPDTGEMLTITQPRAYGHSAIFRHAFAPGTSDKDVVKLMDTPLEGTAYTIAFHPRWKENGFIYVGWNGKFPGAKAKKCAITRYTMATKPPYTIDEASAKNVIEWDSNGHNGAAVCFGGDGMMYVTTGDGTSDSDTDLTGQRTDLLLAKVLRIDVDHPADGKAYSVPKDNPFVGREGFVPEMWAMGLRNPWRMTYDAKTDQLWVCQNGQDLWEQAFLVKKGDNYGWSVTEGGHPFYPNRKAAPVPIVKPTVEHHHSEARSLTGGVVYQGEKYPWLRGAYVYGDYSTGHIWAVKHDGKAIEWHKKIAITTLKITGFALDPAGELVVCHHAAGGDGGFFALTPNPAKQDTGFPKRLSDSGLYDEVKGHKVKPGVIPYSVNAEFWSDGLHKERFIALPPGGGITAKRSGSWDFPDKTVLVKSFALDATEGDPASRKWIETRFLTKQAGEWYGYTYLWNDAGTDATLVGAKGTDATYRVKTAGGEKDFTWHLPGRAECMVCHSRAAQFVLGPSEMQMNKDHVYPNGRTDNQIRVFEHIGMFDVNWAADAGAPKAGPERQQPDQRTPKPTSLLTFSPSLLKKLPNPYDKAQPLEARAKAWLHVNCATCHVEAGGGNAQMQLNHPTAWEKMRLIDEKPLHQTFGLPDAKLVAPGDPARSVLIRRIGARGPNSGQMPPIGTNRVDAAGLELMAEWCKSLRK